MMFKPRLKKKKKRKVKVAREYSPKQYVTKEDKEIFASWMEKNVKEDR